MPLRLFVRGLKAKYRYEVQEIRALVAAIKGGIHLLSKNKPVIVCESENRHIMKGSVMDVLKFILDLGYQGWFIRQGELVPLIEFDPVVHQSQIGDQFWESPDYCNNFIFKPLDA